MKFEGISDKDMNKATGGWITEAEVYNYYIIEKAINPAFIMTINEYFEWTSRNQKIIYTDKTKLLEETNKLIEDLNKLI